jgi:hypothetical protein
VLGIRGGCRKFGTLAKISARHEVGRMGSVWPEDRRFQEMTDPIYCGMNRAFYWHHKKGKVEVPCNILTSTPIDDDNPFPIRAVGVRSEWFPGDEDWQASLACPAPYP